MGDIFLRKRDLINSIRALDMKEEDANLSSEECEHRSLPKLKLADMISQEETYWWQRSRVQWIKDGHHNTTFFHIIASNRKRKNGISEIFINEQLVSNQQRIQKKFLSDFQSLLGTSNPKLCESNWEKLSLSKVGGLRETKESGVDGIIGEN